MGGEVCVPFGLLRTQDLFLVKPQGNQNRRAKLCLGNILQGWQQGPSPSGLSPTCRTSLKLSESNKEIHIHFTASCTWNMLSKYEVLSLRGNAKVGKWSFSVWHSLYEHTHWWTTRRIFMARSHVLQRSVDFQLVKFFGKKSAGVTTLGWAKHSLLLGVFSLLAMPEPFTASTGFVSWLMLQAWPLWTFPFVNFVFSTIWIWDGMMLEGALCRQRLKR